MVYTPADIYPSDLPASLLPNPPKVSIVVGDLSRSGAGRWGGAVRPFLLAQALQRLGCSVKLVGFTFGDRAALASTPELEIITLPGQPYPHFACSSVQLLQQIDGDVIYAYKPKPTSFGVALLSKLLGLGRSRPVLLDIDDWELSWHGGDDWRYRPTPKQLLRDVLQPNGALKQPDHPLYLQMMEKLVARATAVTTHTLFLQQRFGGILVPNGKDTTLFNPADYDRQVLKQHYGLAAYRVLMFPGAPRPYKGVEDVLEAIAQLNQPDLRLVIVGGSPYDDYDQALQQRWGKWIIQLPPQPHGQMPGAIAAADVVVVPQRNTAAAQAQFPLKLTDGMAMAKPILATRVGDIPEILGDTGYLVDSSSPAQLAAGIQQIFADPAAAAANGLRARARCISRYSIDAMATPLAIALKSCL